MRFFQVLFLCLLPLLVTAQAGADLHLATQSFTSASGDEIQAETGYLSVPENRADANSATISIPFVRLKSTATKPVPPVFYLEGGPGASCTWQAENPRALQQWAALLQLGDVVLFDQRGTGAAARRLGWMNTTPLPEDLLVTEQGIKNHFLSMVKPAKQAWEKAGVDFRGYTTMESAKDIDALRRAMGLDKISILGFSYGTHLGQAYMKYYDDHLEKAILIGAEGLGENFKFPHRMDAQFRKLSAMVAADEVVGKEVPDLVGLYQRVSNKLNENPIAVTLRNPLSDADMEIKVGKFGLDYILFRDLGDASDLPVIPRLLHTIDQGDYSMFRWFLQKRIGSAFGLHAMSLTMDFSSGLSKEREAIIERQRKTSMFGNVLNVPMLALKNAWDAPDLGEEYRAGFTSTVPTLLLSGTLDMNTPPHQAEFLRWSLPKANHIVVENAGHEQILYHPAVQSAIIDFLAGKDVSKVTAAYPPLKFIPLSGEREGVGHPSISKK